MKRFAPLVFCFALFLSLWDSALLERETAAISARVLRLHVRASDDTPAAQGRKLLVRDILGETLSPLLSGAEGRDEAVRRAQGEMKDVYAFTIPDYGPEDMGARWHPNAEYNRKVGNMLGEFLKGIKN